MQLTGLVVTNVESYTDDLGTVIQKITAQKSRTKIVFQKKFARGSNADKVVEGMKINLTILFLDDFSTDWNC